MIAPSLEVAAPVVFPGRLVCPSAGAEDAYSVDDQPWKWKGLFEKDHGLAADVQIHTDVFAARADHDLPVKTRNLANLMESMCRRLQDIIQSEVNPTKSQPERLYTNNVPFTSIQKYLTKIYMYNVSVSLTCTVRVTRLMAYLNR